MMKNRQRTTSREDQRHNGNNRSHGERSRHHRERNIDSNWKRHNIRDVRGRDHRVSRYHNGYVNKELVNKITKGSSCLSVRKLKVRRFS